MLRLLRLCAAVLAIAACDRPARHVAPEAPAATETEFLQQVDRSRGVKDMFLPLRAPEFVPAEGAPRMSDDEIVLGLDLAGEQVAYPVLLLNAHEIVEHRLAGLDLLACW
jgi:hypothetical protein